LRKREAPHRQAAEPEARVEVAYPAVARGGAQGDQERVKVLAGRGGEGCVRAHASVRREGVHVAGVEPVPDPIVERLGPPNDRNRSAATVEAPEVVDDAPAPEDEHALLP